MKTSSHNLIAFGLTALFAIGCSRESGGHKVGEVTTSHRWLGANDTIVAENFDDPKIDGVTCFISRAVKGGLGKSAGISEDPSEASIACRQTGPIRIKAAFNQGESVFTQKASPVFKTISVVRFWVPEKKTFQYITVSTKLVNGSPKNSTSAVTAMPWPKDDGTIAAADLSKLAMAEGPR